MVYDESRAEKELELEFVSNYLLNDSITQNSIQRSERSETKMYSVPDETVFVSQLWRRANLLNNSFHDMIVRVVSLHKKPDNYFGRTESNFLDEREEPDAVFTSISPNEQAGKTKLQRGQTTWNETGTRWMKLDS